jgi:Uma2 family endonuclease
MGKSAARVTKPEPVPPLRDGDRMNAREFLRRYEAMGDGVRAELINGVVYIHSPVITPNGKGPIVPPIANERHGRPQGRLIFWATAYEMMTPGVEAAAPVTVVLPSGRQVIEPDAVLRILPESGGRSELGPDDFLYGPPELLVEVANTSASRDVGEKLRSYQADGVREYLVWRTRADEVEWFHLRRNRFSPLRPDTDGVVRSVAFPGLWLNLPALFANDLTRVYGGLQLGIASPEHAAFVEKLLRAAARKRRS